MPERHKGLGGTPVGDDTSEGIFVGEIPCQEESSHQHRRSLPVMILGYLGIPLFYLYQSAQILLGAWLWPNLKPNQCCIRKISKIVWLVVGTPLKSISQLGWLFPIDGKIKNVPNHQPGIFWVSDLASPFSIALEGQPKVQKLDQAKPSFQLQKHRLTAQGYKQPQMADSVCQEGFAETSRSDKHAFIVANLRKS